MAGKTFQVTGAVGGREVGLGYGSQKTMRDMHSSEVQLPVG